MPVAGDEGYEKLVSCPYDKAHEIRMGRMQFHLDKCRKNFPASELTECPFNSAHLIPKVEVEYHTEEECRNRSNWDRHTHEVGDTNCPVKDLVPVNAATVPDGDENWDTFETQGSVLNTIKSQAQEKEIFRMMQCESKAKRKNFRMAERLRLSNLAENGPLSTFSENSTSSTTISGPLRKPTTQPTIAITKQDPEAAAAISQQFRSLDINMKAPKNSASSETSSLYNGPPSVTPPVSTIFDSASVSDAKVTNWPKSKSMSASSRPSTAMSIAASVRTPSSLSNYTEMASSEDNFCQIPIPGLGRGSRGRGKKK